MLFRASLFRASSKAGAEEITKEKYMAILDMYPAKAGSPKTYRANAIGNDATSMTVANGTVLPAGPNVCVIGDDENAEVVYYAAVNGNEVTGMIRGVTGSGTIASPWSAGTTVARFFTSFDHNRFIQNIQDLEANKLSSVSWGDIGGDLEDQSDLQDALDAKQDSLTFDQTPTALSENPVTSGGVLSALDLKAPLASPALTGTPTAPTAAKGTNTTQIATTAFVTMHEPFVITGTLNRGNSTTFTDSRIDSDHWRVIENGITFGTPNYITGNGTWTTNTSNHTITLNITASSSTSVTIAMAWFQ